MCTSTIAVFSTCSCACITLNNCTCLALSPDHSQLYTVVQKAGSGLVTKLVHVHVGSLTSICLVHIVNICMHVQCTVYMYNTLCYISLRLRTAQHRSTPAIVRAPLFSPSLLSTHPTCPYTGGKSGTDGLWVQPMGSVHSVT